MKSIAAWEKDYFNGIFLTSKRVRYDFWNSTEIIKEIENKC